MKERFLHYGFIDLNFFTWLKEKAPYESRAGKLKTEYGKQMNAYNKKQVTNLIICFQSIWFVVTCFDFSLFLYGQESNDGDEASDKSKSEVNDEDEASGEVVHNFLFCSTAQIYRVALCVFGVDQ